MVKIIDFIFPIAPLPKDKKERNAVIEGNLPRVNQRSKILKIYYIMNSISCIFNC